MKNHELFSKNVRKNTEFKIPTDFAVFTAN